MAWSTAVPLSKNDGGTSRNTAKDWADKPVCRSRSLLTVISMERLFVLVGGGSRGFTEFCKGFNTAQLVRQLRRYSRIYKLFHGFTQALYILAENPQYMRPPREEVKSTIEKDGWSKEHWRRCANLTTS
ncbi:hypothetical protein PAXRUDRAFT_614157 [Paxillus rubicundulus Ve08.2h10]|uniref:Uncharacterized protein n=1 Tax=Paxillus rubicundulus Ve08.2h10 TaxID=930991 RepID=A0A0D0E8Z7_9AGAM|nr:hypothetical protein PAXRUDRAFT_614157 [Paxillus rubicundulus Ve08.2h10]